MFMRKSLHKSKLKSAKFGPKRTELLGKGKIRNFDQSEPDMPEPSTSRKLNGLDERKRQLNTRHLVNNICEKPSTRKAARIEKSKSTESDSVASTSTAEMPPNIEKKEVVLKNQEVPESISKGINDDLSIDIVKDLLNPPVLFSSDNQPIIPFFTSKYVFSNHYPAKFTLVNHDYHCTEQYYQFMKVHTNERKDLDQKILEESDPKIIKKIADEIEIPDLERWSKLCWKVMLKCNLEKYMTHQNLRVQLFRTLGATLVEASPTDDYWGVGMSIDDPDLANKSTWKGHNMMGQVLMEIRDYLAGLPEFEKEVVLAKKHLIADTQTRHNESK